jgi:hypothetical protein
MGGQQASMQLAAAGEPVGVDDDGADVPTAASPEHVGHRLGCNADDRELDSHRELVGGGDAGVAVDRGVPRVDGQDRSREPVVDEVTKNSSARSAAVRAGTDDGDA